MSVLTQNQIDVINDSALDVHTVTETVASALNSWATLRSAVIDLGYSLEDLIQAEHTGELRKGR